MLRSVDAWGEVFDSLTQNRFRTVLTATSVAWGIFMLVILLASGTGLQNSLAWQFRDDSTSSIWMHEGYTSKPWAGHRVGRRIDLTLDDFDVVAALPFVEHITARVYLNPTVVYGDERAGFNVRSVHPDHQFLEKTDIVGGRFINDLDLLERRKVAVLGREVVRHLFRGADPLGETVLIDGIAYTVVGHFTDVGGMNEEQQIYLPVTTVQAAYGKGRDVDQIMFTIPEDRLADSEQLAEQVRGLLARSHGFDPTDQRAVRLRNNVERFQQILQVFGFLELFMWIVGLGTVAAGIVGVSNIMMVAVDERKREIGVRKAIGATPGNVVRLVLTEALVLTAASGSLGLVLGVATVEAVSRLLPDNDYMRNPSVDVLAVSAALATLVFAGVFAGLIPARRASRLDPVVALRDE